MRNDVRQRCPSRRRGRSTCLAAGLARRVAPPLSKGGPGGSRYVRIRLESNRGLSFVARPRGPGGRVKWFAEHPVAGATDAELRIFSPHMQYAEGVSLPSPGWGVQRLRRNPAASPPILPQSRLPHSFTPHSVTCPLATAAGREALGVTSRLSAPRGTHRPAAFPCWAK
jgi:hypothetical protein